jgi:hypothetical protein
MLLPTKTMMNQIATNDTAPLITNVKLIGPS